MEPTIVLGLSMNTRLQGLAVISGNDLTDYHIRLRKESWSPRKRELILASLQPWCRYYSIKSVALSIPNEKQTSSQIKELLQAVKEYFREKKIPLTPYPSGMLLSLCQEVKKKKEIMKAITGKYPELSFHYNKELRNKNKYYMKLFEAVGVTLLHSHKLNGKKGIILQTGL